jgi:acetyltransferase-like isoleucine patch superfamily enzyme
VADAIPDDWFPRPLPHGLHIGRRCYPYSAFAFLHCPPSARNVVRIGDDTGLYNGTLIELGSDACGKIGSYYTVVVAIIRAEREVRLGNYVYVAPEVVISDCDGGGAACPRTAGGLPTSCEPRPVVIGDDVWIGTRATFLAGVIIGAGTVVGAGAVVCGDVPPGAVVAGNPARVVRRPARRGEGA